MSNSDKWKAWNTKREGRRKNAHLLAEIIMKTIETKLKEQDDRKKDWTGYDALKSSGWNPFDTMSNHPGQNVQPQVIGLPVQDACGKPCIGSILYFGQ